MNRQGYVGEIVGVVRSEPYYLTSGYELAIPPDDPAQLAQALNDRALIRVTFKLMVEIPGVDEVLASHTTHTHTTTHNTHNTHTRYTLPTTHE